MRKYIINILLILAITVFGQFKKNFERDPRWNLMSPNSSSSNSSFLDMNRFTLDHSYSMVYSSGSESIGMGEYVASVNYKFSKPIYLNMKVGAYHIPYSSFDIPDGESVVELNFEIPARSKIYLKSASLNWDISKNSHLYLGFSSGNGLTSPNPVSPFRVFNNIEDNNSDSDTDLFK